jgi:hypothetical protein
MEVILVTGRRAEAVDLGGQQHCQLLFILSCAGQALAGDDDMPSGQSPYFLFIGAGA